MLRFFVGDGGYFLLSPVVSKRKNIDYAVVEGKKKEKKEKEKKKKRRA